MESYPERRGKSYASEIAVKNFPKDLIKFVLVSFVLIVLKKIPMLQKLPEDIFLLQQNISYSYVVSKAAKISYFYNSVFLRD